MNPVLHGLQLNDLIYGTPNLDQVKKMQKKGKALTTFLEDPDAQKRFLTRPPPPNVSLETKRELEEIQQRTNNISKADREFAQICEDKHHKIWVDFLYENGISVPESWFDNIVAHTDGLTYYLKYHYNRPRPFQLGCYYKLDVYRPIYTDANCAAYPSGHAFESTLFYRILAEKYPHAKTKLNKFHNKIIESRLNAGVHYRTDLEFGMELADWAFSKKIF